jgi:hypothetical protein
MTVTELDEPTAEMTGEDEDPGADLGPDDDDDGEGEDDDAPDAAQAAVETPPSTQADIEGKLKKIATSAQTFRRRVDDLLGEDAQHLVACELCEPEIPGFHWPAELAQPRDETHARLLDVLRSPAAPDYVAASGMRTCEVCQGWGKVKTGSRVAGQEITACPTCRAFGYVPPPGSVQGEVFTADGDGGSVNAPTDFGPQADADPWGSPRVMPDGQLNPNYGRMPQYKDDSLP